MNTLKKTAGTFLLIMFFFSVMAAQTAWSGGSESWSKGAGTEADPYLIEKPEHLAFLAQEVSQAGRQTYEGKFFRLENNLNMGTSMENLFAPKLNFPSIGFYQEDSEHYESVAFEGTFDGNGKTIDNLFIGFKAKVDDSGHPIPTPEARARGLFTLVGKKGVVKNLRLGSVVRVAGQDCVGAFVGILKGKLIACGSDASLIEGELILGGLVGETYAPALIDRCYSRALIGVSYAGIGSLVGWHHYDATIRNCYALGRFVKAGGIAGGFVGGVNGTSAIENSYTAVVLPEINSTGDSISVPTEYGGIAGRYYDETPGKVTNSYYAKDLLRIDHPYANPNFYPENGTAIASADMKNGSFATKLSDAFTEDTEHVNAGYPVLKGVATPLFTTEIRPVLPSAYDDSCIISVGNGLVTLSGRTVTGISAFAPDGKQIASVCGNCIRLPEGTFILRAQTPQGTITRKLSMAH